MTITTSLQLNFKNITMQPVTKNSMFSLQNKKGKKLENDRPLSRDSY